MASDSRGLVLFGLMMGLFLAAIEATVVSTAMPKAASSMGGAEFYSWIFTAYILSATVTGPLWGRLADMHGRRRVYLAGVAVFLVGSALSGAAQDMLQLVLFRGLQGVGGGALMTLTFTIVGELYRLRERSRVQGYLSSVWAVASILGPPAGGFIADNIDWRWVFYINIPFGVAASMIVVKGLIEPDHKRDDGLDLPGVLAFTLASSTILIYLTEYSTIGELGLLLLTVSAASMILFIKIEASAKAPLIPFNLLRDRVLAISLVGSLLSGLTFFGVLTYLPILLQWALGLTASNAGLLLTPSTLGWVVSSIIASRLLPRVTLKPIVLISIAFTAAGMLALILFHAPPMVAVGGFLMGVGMGSAVAPLLIVVQTVVAPASLGIATALIAFMRSMGGAVGVTLMWIPIKTALDAAGLKTVSSITAAQQSILSAAISNAFIIGLAATLLCIPLYLLLPRLDLDERDRARFSD